MDRPPPAIVVLGASGLVGHAVARHLIADGLRVVGIARRFTAAQEAALGASAVQSPVVGLDAGALAGLLAAHNADIVVNCIGVLQDSARGTTGAVHRDFTASLVAAVAALEHPCLLMQVSVPGRDEDDHTAFAVTKREAERVIAAAGIPHVILRPGFVVATAAYGGSALVRALAALPLDLPARESARPFAAVDVADIGRTVAAVARRWRDGERAWSAAWDLMERDPSTVGGVVAAFARWLGGPRQRLRLPSWLLVAGSKAGDAAARLGWSPPIRSAALAEMRRGVAGDPGPWIAATGIEPVSLREALARRPASVQERWFARLYLVKPLLIGTLALFWAATGAIALAMFDVSTAMLAAHGVPAGLAAPTALVTSLADIAVGAAIAVRRTCRAGLLASLALALAYMASATVLAPALWLDPAGSLVKIAPAIVLAVAALTLLDDR